MTEAQKHIRKYLAEIGERGELIESARTHQIARAANGRDPRDETGCD